MNYKFWFMAGLFALPCSRQLCAQDSAEMKLGIEGLFRLAGENYGVTVNRYDNELALLTDLLDAGNTKLAADLGMVNARINVIYSFFKMKYLTHTL